MMEGIKQVFERNALSIIGEIRSKLQSTGANATGKTSASLEQIATDNRLQILGDKSFLFVETGRRAGKMPPFAPILEWAKARGLIQNEKQGLGLVFAIRKSIADKGTTTVSLSKPRDIYFTTLTDQRVNSIVAQIQDFAADKVLRDVIVSQI